MSRTVWRGVTTIVLLGLLVACGREGAPAAAPGDLQATVVDMVNDVDAHPLPDQEWQDAAADMVIYQDGQVRAQEASTARLDVLNSLVRVAPNSIFTLGQPDPDTVQVSLEEGQVWIDVEGLAPEESFEVETPAAVASVRGTRFSVRTLPDGSALVSTRVGTVTVAAAGTVVTVPIGLQTTVAPGGTPVAPTPMSDEEDLRWGMAGTANLDVVLPTTGVIATFAHPTQSYAPNWSPDGRYFSLTYYGYNYSGDELIGTVIYDVGAGSVITPPLPPGVIGVSFSPTGTVAYQQEVSEGGPTSICTADANWNTTNCFGGDAYYGTPHWSPGGDWLLFYSHTTFDYVGDGEPGSNVFVARPDGSQMTRLTNDPAEYYHLQPTWSPTGEWIAFIRKQITADTPGDLWVVRPDGSQAHMVFPGITTGGNNNPMMWSGDGSTLLAADAEGRLWQVHPESPTRRLLTGMYPWRCWQPAWAPTGSGWPIYFVGADPKYQQKGLWVLPSIWQEPMLVAGMTGWVNWGPIWSPQGDRLAIGFYDNRASEWGQTQVYILETVPGFMP